MPLSLPTNVIQRQIPSHQSKFSRRTMEHTAGLPVGRLSRQPLAVTPPPYLQRDPSHSRYIRRRTRQKERELIEIQKINVHEPQKGELVLPTFQWIRGTMIGKGSQAKVYMALNVTTGEVMAVKQVGRPKSPQDGSQLRRIAESLREEKETLKNLSHPNVVQCLGFEENQQTLNIFLEYVSGGTIDSCVKAFGKIREDVTKYFTQQILGGLAYLHSEGILHRDLKASNILVMDSGVCKISDFGISKRNQRAFTFTGTAYCMAPETLCPGRDGYDSKVDVWSVGCVVQQMWTGMRAWAKIEFLTVWCKLGEGELPPLPDNFELSMSAHHFREECFQIEPERRPSAAVLLMHPYLELARDWEFPGMRALGSVPKSVKTEYNSNRSDISATHAPASIMQDLQMVSVSSTLLPVSPANKSSAVFPIPQPHSLRPLPFTPALRPLPSPPLTPLSPSRLLPKSSSSSLASVSSSNTLAMYCDHPRCNGLRIPTIPECDDSASQTMVSTSPRKEYKSPLKTPPHSRPDLLSPNCTHVFPQSDIEMTTQRSESLLRKVGSNPEISSIPLASPHITRTHRAYSTSGPAPQPEVSQISRRNTKPRSLKPLPTPPTSIPSPTQSPAPIPSPAPSTTSTSSAGSLGPRPLPSPSPRQPPPISIPEDTITSTISGRGSTWQKPPPQLVLSRSEDNFQSRPRKLSVPSPSTRPDIREVVEQLEDYFPEHNLDAPVVMENDPLSEEEIDSPILDPFMSYFTRGFSEVMGIYEPDDREGVARKMSMDTRRSRKRTMKSIKSIAEENAFDQFSDDSLTLRQTRCWDSRVEEIRVPW